MSRSLPAACRLGASVALALLALAALAPSASAAFPEVRVCIQPTTYPPSGSCLIGTGIQGGTAGGSVTAGVCPGPGVLLWLDLAPASLRVDSCAPAGGNICVDFTTCV